MYPFTEYGYKYNELFSNTSLHCEIFKQFLSFSGIPSDCRREKTHCLYDKTLVPRADAYRGKCLFDKSVRIIVQKKDT